MPHRPKPSPPAHDAAGGSRPLCGHGGGGQCGVAYRVGWRRLGPEGVVRFYNGRGTPRRSGPWGTVCLCSSSSSPAAERAGEADQDGRPSGAALPVVDLSVVRDVGSSTVVPGSVGSYRPVIAGAKLREGTTTILPRGGERSRESACLQCAIRQRWTRSMVQLRIDRRLTLAGPDYAVVWAGA